MREKAGAVKEIFYYSEVHMKCVGLWVIVAAADCNQTYRCDSDSSSTTVPAVVAKVLSNITQHCPVGHTVTEKNVGPPLSK